MEVRASETGLVVPQQDAEEPPDRRGSQLRQPHRGRHAAVRGHSLHHAGQHPHEERLPQLPWREESQALLRPHPLQPTPRPVLCCCFIHVYAKTIVLFSAHI